MSLGTTRSQVDSPPREFTASHEYDGTSPFPATPPAPARDAGERLYVSVTAVIVGYEWQGVAFGDPASKVQAAFRQMGFKIDKNGDFAVDDDVAVVTTIRPTDAGAKSRGQSELICGI